MCVLILQIYYIGTNWKIIAMYFVMDYICYVLLYVFTSVYSHWKTLKIYGC